MGRKSIISTKDFRADWKEWALKEFEQGVSLNKIRKELRLSQEAHLRLLRDDEEYRDVVDEGKMAHDAWWIEQGRENLKNKDFNNSLWCFNMKNRLGWRDNPVTLTKDGSVLPNKTEEAEILAKYQREVNTNEKDSSVN